ncbi:MAG: Crp/Fnr family transcriptional regulator [Ferruginibacter sp.]
MQPNLIQHISRFVPLDDDDIRAVLNHTSRVSAKKKSVLLKEGHVSKRLFFVEKGCLRLYFINDKGIEQITQFAIEDWWLTDYMSYTTRNPSQFYIQAIENTELYALDQTEQEELLKAVPALERYFRLVLQKAYAAAQVRLKFLHDFSKEESYHHFVNAFPGFVQRIPQYMLASYLGFTPEYLSELRKKIQ